MTKEQKLKEALEGMLSVVDGPLKEAAKGALRLADELTKTTQDIQQATTYETGQRFLYTPRGDEYILASMGYKVALINLENGNFFNAPVNVGNPFKITSSEFSKITFGKLDKFHLIQS